MQPLNVLARKIRRAPRVTILFVSLLLLSLGTGCAEGVTATTSTGGGEGGDATTTTSGSGGTTSTGGVGGSGGTGGSGGAGAAGGTGGSGGTGGTTTTTTTTTTTGSGGCTEVVGSNDYPAEVESNNLKSSATPLPDGALGFSAALCPIGDIDVFAIPVTVPGASMRLEISNGSSGCPAGAQTYVRIFTEDGTLLAQDTDGGNGNCSLISPSTESAVASLPLGTYYVQIENLSLAKVESYRLDAAVSAPACGDGVLQQGAGEQCDDGNTESGDGCTLDCLIEVVCGDGTTHVIAGEQCDDSNILAGDGCSATCQIEGVLLVNESEPNGADVPDDLTGYDGAVASINPEADQDWFSFEITIPGSTVTASISNGKGVCPSGVDTKLFLLDALDNEIVSDDDDGDGNCSAISPVLDPEVQNLPAGMYKLRAEAYSDTSTIPAYVLLLHVGAPGCGDGVLQLGEQCEDSNVDAGDGCSPTCQFEGNYTAEVEPNPLATPGSLTGFEGVIASIQPAGDKDAFSFQVTVPGSSVVIEVSDGLGACPAFDSILTLYNPQGTVIVTDDQGGISPCSKIDPFKNAGAKDLPVGTYKVLVEESGNNAVAPQYILTVKVTPPSCGDQLIAATEQCDDGNTVAGDGCSATCQAEAPWEIEPNGTLDTATPLWAGFSTWKATISVAGDKDWFKFSAQAGQSVALQVHSVDDPGNCPFDAQIFLIDGAGTVIAMDDDDGIGLCSLINPGLDMAATNLAGGPYYVRVERVGNALVGGPYQVDVTVQ